MEEAGAEPKGTLRPLLLVRRPEDRYRLGILAAGAVAPAAASLDVVAGVVSEAVEDKVAAGVTPIRTAS